MRGVGVRYGEGGIRGRKTRQLRSQCHVIQGIDVTYDSIVLNVCDFERWQVSFDTTMGIVWQTHKSTQVATDLFRGGRHVGEAPTRR